MLWQLQWEKVALCTGKVQPHVAVGSAEVLHDGDIAPLISSDSPVYILMQAERLRSLPVPDHQSVAMLRADPPRSRTIASLLFGRRLNEPGCVKEPVGHRPAYSGHCSPS